MMSPKRKTLTKDPTCTNVAFFLLRKYEMCPWQREFFGWGVRSAEVVLGISHGIKLKTMTFISSDVKANIAVRNVGDQSVGNFKSTQHSTLLYHYIPSHLNLANWALWQTSLIDLVVKAWYSFDTSWRDIYLFGPLFLLRKRQQDMLVAKIKNQANKSSKHSPTENSSTR